MKRSIRFALIALLLAAASANAADLADLVLINGKIVTVDDRFAIAQAVAVKAQRVVTGKMIGGRQVNRQSITREEALIAHTRSNARIVFQEANLGSISRGKYADLVVLDRDYLTVAADEIKDLKPVLTMVGGRIVYETR